MSATTRKPKRQLTSLELSKDARDRLNRLKNHHGMTKTFALEKGLELLEQTTKGTK